MQVSTVVQLFPSLHTVLPLQTPCKQTSGDVHASPSLQAVPLAALGFVQTPVVVLQVPATWQASWAWQTIGAPPVQVPATHASTVVQALLSLQAVPSAANTMEHTPVDVLHTPGTRQALLAVQTTGLAPTHCPP